MMTASIGKKANVTLSKKGSIIADNNILPDPDEALKLGKSICLIELAFDMKKATKASKRAYRIQQQSTGSSKGAGITLEVPDEPKGSFAAQADDDD
ncbi:hypothetical protein Tco_1397162 [Tanacetum coccineum]